VVALPVEFLGLLQGWVVLQADCLADLPAVFPVALPVVESLGLRQVWAVRQEALQVVRRALPQVWVARQVVHRAECLQVVPQEVLQEE